MYMLGSAFKKDGSVMYPHMREFASISPPQFLSRSFLLGIGNADAEGCVAGIVLYAIQEDGKEIKIQGLSGHYSDLCEVW